MSSRILFVAIFSLKILGIYKTTLKKTSRTGNRIRFSRWEISDQRKITLCEGSRQNRFVTLEERLAEMTIYFLPFYNRKRVIYLWKKDNFFYKSIFFSILKRIYTWSFYFNLQYRTESDCIIKTKLSENLKQNSYAWWFLPSAYHIIL